MKLSILLAFVSMSMFAQTTNSIHATAQCESVNSDVLGITSLQICDIGVTNYSANTVVISEGQIREWFPALDIENSARAQAVGDKAFNNSKKSKAIAALNFLSPLAVAFMGGGLIHASVEAIAAMSLANTAAQSFKNYLIGQQPNEASFLPNLPSTFTLTPYGTQGFSAVYTVLGSIDFTNSPVVQTTARRFGSKAPVRSGTLTWQGNLPGTIPATTLPPASPIIKGSFSTGDFPAITLTSSVEHTHSAINDTTHAYVISWEVANDKMIPFTGK